MDIWKKIGPHQDIVPNPESSKLTAIGNLEPVCPYCTYKFDRMPLKKKKCPQCGNFIRSRTRPFDNKKVLIKEDQIEELERQWAFKNEQSGNNRIGLSFVFSLPDEKSSQELQKILDKPWSEVTIEDRKILCSNNVKLPHAPHEKTSPNIGRVIEKIYLRDWDAMSDEARAAYQSPVEKALKNDKDAGLFPTKIWVIPPEGCPIEVHKFLDGQTRDANELFTIGEDTWSAAGSGTEWDGYQAKVPRQFGEPALDDNCRCWIVAGWRKIE